MYEETNSMWKTDVWIPVRVNRGKNKITSWSYIEGYVVGRWRGLTYYGGQKEVVTNKKKLLEMETTIRVNAGWERNGYHPIIHWDWKEPVIEFELE